MNGTRAVWLGRYEGELARVFAEATGGLSALPAPLADLASSLLKSFNPVTSNPGGAGGGTNYICFLLPFWFKELTGCGDGLCRELAVGNVYAMLHFFLLDDAMDAKAASDPKKTRRALALGQMLQEAFKRRYGRCFPAESPLWERYETYLADWACAVADEGDQKADPANPAALARKSAPVKLCAAGMLLLSGRAERLPQMEEALDLALATLQLSDDWADWREDLAEDGERRNAFLTLVRRALELPSNQPLEERLVKRGIYRIGCLRELVGIAKGHHEKLVNMPEVPEVLLAFHADIVMGLEKDAIETEERVDQLAAEGGLSMLLSNLSNK